MPVGSGWMVEAAGRRPPREAPDRADLRGADRRRSRRRTARGDGEGAPLPGDSGGGDDAGRGTHPRSRSGVDPPARRAQGCLNGEGLPHRRQRLHRRRPRGGAPRAGRRGGRTRPQRDGGGEGRRAGRGAGARRRPRSQARWKPRSSDAISSTTSRGSTPTARRIRRSSPGSTSRGPRTWCARRPPPASRRVVFTSSAASIGEAQGTVGDGDLFPSRLLPLGLRPLQARRRAGRLRGRRRDRRRGRRAEPILGPGTAAGERQRRADHRLPERPSAGVRRHPGQHRRRPRRRPGAAPRRRGGNPGSATSSTGRPCPHPRRWRSSPVSRGSNIGSRWSRPRWPAGWPRSPTPRWACAARSRRSAGDGSTRSSTGIAMTARGRPASWDSGTRRWRRPSGARSSGPSARGWSRSRFQESPESPWNVESSETAPSIRCPIVVTRGLVHRAICAALEDLRADRHDISSTTLRLLAADQDPGVRASRSAIAESAAAGCHGSMSDIGYLRR